MSTNGDTPATKGDVAKLREELLGAIGTQRGELLGAIGAQREELLEAIHDSETRLLKAFYNYAESAQKHFIDLDRADYTLRDRLGSLETRLVEIEKRLNMPPTAS